MSVLPPAPFGRVLTAMATAFKDDGSVDLDGTAKIAHHLVEHGHDGVVVSGTTGEAPTTTVAEDGEILTAVKDAVGDRASVVAGVGTNSTAHSLELARQAEKIGADGLLLVTPYYNKPGQAGVLHHFRTVAEATGVPVMLYDVPGRTGTQISMETYVAARELDTVVAVKDAVGDFARGVRLRELGYAVYSGDDISNLAWLAHGASGFVSVVGHVAGDQTRAMLEAFDVGDPTRALEIFTSLLPAIDAVMGVPNYGATTAKAGLQLLGVLDNRNVRGPLVPLDDDEVAALRVGLEASGLL
ncbi:MAG TPA: 4-hydroxy-tetrahydrodipicolinate synthase [Nocardioides sp.]|uniref:4-hydroxy-tetrahydrodipicolinate synthase n=1 Tax=uncultured Nocardioides sp. TaxID=198441 RepID=UPI000ED303EB|nr:4-hydroxy-tetrahydrodipicolinate synthase [uncultured Nocardioides sp.]HCB07946.1 4-hydroxy-tetrahydrodipicolinate synthase [Nocardioides sp.]HRD60413.1 4-hydroxy-tetrahydrodipicolinate synthase [Nocardioides sp.]HRI96451.1 4-hydroxy-tetrahydrodipicolinate synthase [Nocardioides sp.]HRK46359.1 4-hydroxy-tetrahydrodipicolinate synthase [Nocardioides sp.]